MYKKKFDHRNLFNYNKYMVTLLKVPESFNFSLKQRILILIVGFMSLMTFCLLLKLLVEIDRKCIVT